MKKFYKGVFNLRCEMDVMYAWAYSTDQAWAIFCRRVAQKHGVNVGEVMGIFVKGNDKYRIEEATDDRN